MLAAYEGRASDIVPVAPEFWTFIPARVLGVSMVEFEREVPHWQALQTTFFFCPCAVPNHCSHGSMRVDKLFDDVAAHIS